MIDDSGMHKMIDLRGLGKKSTNTRTCMKQAPTAKALYLGGKDTMAVFQTTVDTSPGIL